MYNNTCMETITYLSAITEPWLFYNKKAES